MRVEEEVGVVVNYFSKIGVAAVEITSGELKLGDTVRFKGATTDFTQKVDSMQIEKKPVDKAAAGSTVGIKVKERVRPKDKVYKIIGEA